MTSPHHPCRRLAAVAAALSLLATPVGADRLFVSEFAAGNIWRYDLPSATQVPFASGLSLPEDGACSPTTGLVFFAESNFDLMTRWDQNGASPTNIIPTVGSIAGPEGLSFNPAGDLYFNTRDRFGTMGAWSLAGGDPANPAMQVVMPFTSFGEGSELAWAGPHAGALFLIARGEQRVMISEPPGTPPVEFIPASAFPPNVDLFGVTTNGCGEVFVSFGGVTPPIIASVYRFDAQGAFIDEFLGGLSRAGYMEFDSEGNLYVADSNGNAVWKVLPDKTASVFAVVSNPLGLAICRDRQVPACWNLSCNAGGPYLAECAGARTCLRLDGGASGDLSGETPTYAWSSDCPGATFDDATSPTPEICLDSTSCSLTCNVSLTVSNRYFSTNCASTVTVEDTLRPTLSACALKPVAPPGPASSAGSPVTPLPPLPPRLPGSACSAASSGRFEVVCGDAADQCDPSPAVSARVVLTRTELPSCTVRIDTVDVACGEVLDLVRLAPPCLARPPRSPRPPVAVGSDGIRVLAGEDIRLEVEARDRCDLVSDTCTATPDLCQPVCPLPACPAPPASSR